MTQVVNSTTFVKKFREYMARAEAGETIIITHYRRPRAMLVKADQDAIGQPQTVQPSTTHEPS